MEKVNVSVLGCCVSRDSLEYQKDKYNVVKYCAFVSPFTMFDGQTLDLTIEQIAQMGCPNFQARSVYLDIHKGTMGYLGEIKADWLLLDVLDARYSVLEWKNSKALITNSFIIKKITDPLFSILGKGENPFKREPWELPERYFNDKINEFADKVLEVYKSEQIIFHEFWNVSEFIKANGVLASFDKNTIGINNRQNIIIKKIYNILEDRFKGCHLIKAPDNVLADEKHRWGLAPLHYFDIYYEYAEKALSTVVKNIDMREEEKQLEDLRQLYTEKFALIREKAIENGIRLDRDKWQRYSNTFKAIIVKGLLSLTSEAKFQIEEVFLELGAQHIAIYGESEIAKVLIYILKNTSIQIDYIVANGTVSDYGIPKIGYRAQEFPKVDCMIISDIIGYNRVKGELEKKGIQFPLYNAAEFIQSLPAGQGIGELQAYVNSLKEKQADLEENVAQLQKSAEAYAAEKAQMQAAFGELSDRYQASEQKAADLATEVDGLQVKNKAAQRDIEELSVENKAAKEEIEGLHRKQTEAQKQIVAITSQRDAAVADAASLRNSVSYKFGRAMTFLPRKISDVFKKK